MSIDELMEEGRIQKFAATKEEIKKSLEIGDRDIKLAEEVLRHNLDWCLTIAYNAVLQVCRAYMFSLGYRPSSFEAHKTVFKFMNTVVNQDYKEIVSYFDRIRRKRHRTMYDEIGIVSKKEAKEGIRMAKEFITIVKKWIKSGYKRKGNV